jgi:hypothetical protein
MRIGGRQYQRDTVLRYVGHVSQIGGTRHYELVEGAGKGLRAIDFDTGAGLHFSVLPDRGLDISRATYNGLNLVYRSPSGEMAPAFAEPPGRGWLRTFFGGLLTTCGLTHFGPACTDEGIDLGMHGRHNYIPAQRVCDRSAWEGDEYVLTVTGTVEDSVIFGDRIRLTRTVSARIGENRLRICDLVTNFGYQPSPFTILYHVNAGFPLLSPEAELVLSRTSTRPHNEQANKAGVADVTHFGEPIDGFEEQNYLHDMAGDENGFAWAAMINRSLGDRGGLGLALKFSVDTLPVMAEWKMMGAGDYVVGMEPCNVDLLARSELRARGLLPLLQPGERREMTVEIEILDGGGAIDGFTEIVRHISPMHH